MVWHMSDESDLVGRLESAGVLDGLRWANESASRGTLDDYSEWKGHDAAWLGLTRFTLLRDRIDRFTSSGRYEISVDEFADQGLDVLHEALTRREIREMPELANDLVNRADLNGSPGWRIGKVRILLASCAYGKIETLPWPRKSPTKQKVARTPHLDPQMTLFEGMPEEELAGLLAIHEGVDNLTNLVVAHSLDPIRHRSELVLGRPRYNWGGGSAWHWSKDLLADPPSRGSRRTPPSTPPPDRDDVPDAPVQLRRQSDEESETS